MDAGSTEGVKAVLSALSKAGPKGLAVRALTIDVANELKIPQELARRIIRNALDKAHVVMDKNFRFHVNNN